MKAPAFQFYAADFYDSAAILDQHETGALIRLICQQWTRGGLPANQQLLERLAGGPVSETVLAKFPQCPDGIRRNERLEFERQKQAEYRERQRHAGLASAEARKSAAVERRLNGGSIPVEAGLQPKGNSPSPSPSPSLPLIAIDKASASDLTSQELPPQRVPTKAKKPLKGKQKELADRIQAALGEQWVNDAGKWITRIKTPAKFSTCESVTAELENAIKESRISTTPAQFAEDTWKHFSNPKSVMTKTTRSAIGRVDRSIGTANEGLAHQYKGLGRIKPELEPTRTNENQT